MRAPSEESSTPSTKSGPASGDAPGRRRAGPWGLSPQACLVLAVLVLGFSTYAAVIQKPHPNAYRQTSVLSGEWWTHPFEWNPPGRLPVVGRDLKDVYAVPGTKTVYAVGELGTVLVSDDDGQTWQRAADRTPTPTPTPSASPSPSATPSTTPVGNANTNANTNTNTGNMNAGNMNTNRGNSNAGNMNVSNMNAGNMNRGEGDRNAKANRGTGSAGGAQASLLALLDFVPAASAAERDVTGAREPAQQDAGGVQGPTPTPTPRSSRGRAGGNRNATSREPSNVTATPATPVATASPTPTGPASVGGKTLIGLNFHSEREGVVVTDLDECLSTGDGGVSWSYCDAQEMPATGNFFEAYTGAVRYVGPSALPPIIWISTDRRPAFFRVAAVPPSPDSAGTARKPGAEDVPKPRTEFGANTVFLAGEEEPWLVAGGEISHSTDGGRTWEVSKSGVPDGVTLRSIFFVDKPRGWVVGDGGVIVATSDGGKTWVQQGRGVTEQDLKSVSFHPDGLRGWAVGDGGTVLHTEDGGATWVHQARARPKQAVAAGGAQGAGEAAGGGYYFRLLPPWYYLSWVVVALLLLPVRRTAVLDLGEEPEPSVADVLVSDRPLEEGDRDTINFKAIAFGLSRFLRNENTRPPLTIAITGEWGTGKSSLMNLLRADLRRYDFRPVWFNAWHHQKEEHLLASLLQNVRLQAVPPFWRPEGIVFRLRLLVIRGARHWVPVLLVVVFAAVAVFYELLRETPNTQLAQGFKWVGALFSTGGAQQVSEGTKAYLSRLPLLVSLLTLGGTIWRGATAFGVKPASLLASMSRGVRVRDLDAQTSFRQRFAAEFNDVTKALGARSMLVFIDDLDRCRPENVVETLEAVNFLVTSGECFVVIGMARERVEPCVGLSFKDVAAEMRDEQEARGRAEDEAQRRGDAGAQGPGGAGAQKPSPEDQERQKRLQEEKARDKRFDYARQYLDKLINIEVPVPAPDAAQSRDILLANARHDEVPDAATQRSRWRRLVPAGAEAMARDYGLLLLWLAGLVLLLSACYGLASLLARPAAVGGAAASPQASPTASPTATPVPTPTPTGMPGGVASPPVSSRPQPTPTAAPSPVPSPTPTNVDELTAGRNSVVLAAGPVLLVVLTVLWVAFWVLTRRPGLVVKDSPKFIRALEVWHQLVFEKSSTPRSVKRFMNRVRYLAMRQRPQDDSPPAWKRLLNRYFPPKGGDTAARDGKTNGAVKPTPIPEELLVALAAIEHFKPHWLEDDKASEFIRASTGEKPPAFVVAGSEEKDWKLFRQARREHDAAEGFKAWDAQDVLRALKQFRGQSQEVKAN